MNINLQLDAAAERQKSLGRLVDNSPVIVFLWRIEPGQWPVEVVSASVQGLLGYTAEDFMSARVSWPGITHPKDVPRLEQEVGNLLAAGRDEWSQQYRLVAKDGRTVWVEDRDRVVRDAAGKATHIQAIIMDITGYKRVEEQLRESEARFKDLAETIRDVFWISTPTIDRMLFVSPAYETIWGRTCESLYQRPLSFAEAVHPEDQARFMAAVPLHAKGKWEIEYRILRPDGAVRWILDRGFPIRDDQGTVVRMCGIAKDITERKRAEEELRGSREALRALFTRLELAREEERTRVARDIHDDLGQNLTAIKMDLRWIERALEKAAASPGLDAVKARAISAIEVADAMTAVVQELATQLRPGVLDKLGLGPAIRFELRRFQAHSGIKCGASVPDALPSPAPAVATALFRILQECLTNVARHSGATRTSVRLDVRGNDLLLRVHDNGSGIAAEALDRPMSLGLLGMKERAAVLDGEVTIRRNRNRGTVVTVRIPNHET